MSERAGSLQYIDDMMSPSRGEEARRAEAFERTAETTRLRVQSMRRPGRYTLHPPAAWEWLMLVSVFTAMALAPYDFAFAKHRTQHEFEWLRTVDLVLWALFVVDLVLQFFVWKKQGDHWVRCHKELILCYLRQGFIMDLVACAPPLKFVRLCRVLKTARLFRLHFKRYHSMVLVNLMCVMVFFIVMAHWLACVWGLVSNVAGSPRNSWMSELLEFRQDSTLSILKPRVQYLFSLYFVVTTLTTVGYGDVSPRNLTERAAIIVIMIVGGLVYATILATITQALTTLDTDRVNSTRLFDQVNWMLADMDVSEQTRRKARAYLINASLVHRRSKYQELLGALGVGLQRDVVEEVFAAKMSVVPYFRPLRRSVRLALFKEFKHALFMPGEHIENCKTLLIITNSSGQIGCCGRYHYFGAAVHLDFITSDDDPPDLTVSVHYTTAETLTRDAVQRVAAQFPLQTFSITKARLYYALLKFARCVLRRRRSPFHRLSTLASRHAHHRYDALITYLNNRSLDDDSCCEPARVVEHHQHSIDAVVKAALDFRASLADNHSRCAFDEVVAALQRQATFHDKSKRTVSF